MSSIRLGAASSVQAFQKLGSALASSEGKWAHLIDSVALEDELGRFRVWAGNLGALQKGHSSLDYRLRDSPLLSSNVLKLLEELQDNIGQALAIVSGVRLPYEQQLKSEEAEEEEDDDFFSEDEDDGSEPGVSKTELEMRFGEIIDIIDNLYKLGVRIRTPTIRSRSLKAASYQPKDPETGVDILEQYSKHDHQHTCDLIRHLRKPYVGEAQDEDTDFVSRLSRGITLRRRQFKYWKRHRDKLGISTLLEEKPHVPEPVQLRPDAPQRNDTLEAQADDTAVIPSKEAPSQKTGRTMLSGTEATHHHQSLDDIVDKQSVTSYAVTVRDLSGKGIELPPPPKAADGEKDFECPYCFIICPSRYSKGRAWKTHILQDLQPYVCTYPECESQDQLFRSRREWSEHEATHRKAWRCPEHLSAVYKSPAGLEEHLRRKHLDSFPESQLESIVRVGETSTVDVRDKCPICYAPADMEGMGGLQNHIANHLERIATFALPPGTEDDSDGGSGIASRGRTGSSGSQDLSAVTFGSEMTEEEENFEIRDSVSAQVQGETKAQKITSSVEREQTLSSLAPLSAESLHNLPDVTQNRLDTLFSSDMAETSDFEELDIDGTPAEVEEHLKKLEEFRSYLLSLPGAQSVRFFRRYGRWRGNVYFADEAAATLALKPLDNHQFPNLTLRHNMNNKSALKFIYSNPDEENRPRSSHQTTDADRVSISSISIADDEQDEGELPPILDPSNIPSLRSMYRSRKLLQRDQSYASNDSYNQIVSLCSYDITRLRVDAIINSANRSMKITKSSATLNWRIHKAAGPELKKECSMQAKIKVKAGQAIVTPGFNLPSKNVIHVSRPSYTGSTEVGRLNILTECYRTALTIAKIQGLKTIAFPCLGAGGCGFPPRLATRIALQEIREFLDSHPDHPFERIVFCVYSSIDEKAYMDFLPVYFPPTHGDLENAVSSAPITNRSVLGWEVLEVHGQVSTVYLELTKYSDSMQDFPSLVLDTLKSICEELGGLKDLLLSGLNPIQNLKEPSLSDIHLICSAMQAVCGSITEITELAKSYESQGQSSHTAVWNDYNFHMKNSYGSDLSTVLWVCQKFVQGLEDILLRDAPEPQNMSFMRKVLTDFKTKQTGHSEQTIQQHFDEVMYTREYQRTTNAPARTNAIKLHQIPSVSRLYQTGELEQRSTFAVPSAHFNYMVYLVREDITNIEADIIVNSTDYTFGGMGTLDRTIFRRGGPEMQEEVKQFANCETGSVKVTPGYRLLAKHVLHMVPPESWRQNTKSILRKMYQEIFHTANSLRASSIAIPSIGTGMLSYPRRDSAALALEEAKRFLESAGPTSSLERIIFVVYSSTDEFTYKSVIPLYFPPVDSNVNKALPSSTQPTQPSESADSAMSSDSSSSTPRRTLFGSLGDAIRSVRFGKQPVSQVSRPPNNLEENVLIDFESHAKDCAICSNINKLYLEGKNLCEDGYPLAQLLLQYLNMEADGAVYSKPAANGQRARIEIPSMFPLSRSLLVSVEKSFRDQGRTGPFVSPNIPYSDIVTQHSERDQPPAGVTIYNAEVTVPVNQEPEKAVASVHKWSTLSKRWDALYPHDCAIHVWPGRVDVRTDVGTAQETQDQQQIQVPLLSLELTPTVQIRVVSHLEIDIQNAGTFQDSVIKSSGRFMFLSKSWPDTQALFQKLKAAQASNPRYAAHRSQQAVDESQESNLPIQFPNVPQHDPTEPAFNLAPLSSGYSTPTSEPGRDATLPLQEFLAPTTRQQRNPGPLGPNTQRPPTLLPKAILAHLKSLQNSNTGTATDAAAEADTDPQPIGQHEQDIASSVGRPLHEVTKALTDLKKLYLVQNTLDSATWAANPDAEGGSGIFQALGETETTQTQSDGEAGSDDAFEPSSSPPVKKRRAPKRIPHPPAPAPAPAAAGSRTPTVDYASDSGDDIFVYDSASASLEGTPSFSSASGTGRNKKTSSGLFSRWTGSMSSFGRKS